MGVPLIYIVGQAERQGTPLTYSIIYGRLKHKFRVGSYSEAPDERFDEIMVYLKDELRKAFGGDLPEQGSLL